MPLSFENLRAANTRRGEQWDGKPASLDDLSFRGLEFVGEAGEAANLCKKLARHLTGRVGGMPLEEARSLIAEELADTVICADRVAQVICVDLGSAVVAKFNKTSLKHGFAQLEPNAELQLEIDNAKLRAALMRVTASLGLILGGGASGTGPGHTENLRIAKLALKETYRDPGFTAEELAQDHAAQIAEDKREVRVEQARSADAALKRQS